MTESVRDHKAMLLETLQLAQMLAAGTPEESSVSSSGRGSQRRKDNDEKETKGVALSDDGNSTESAEMVYAPAGTLAEAINLYQGKPDKRGRVSWTRIYPEGM